MNDHSYTDGFFFLTRVEKKSILKEKELIGGVFNRTGYGKVRNGIEHLGLAMIGDGEAKYRMVE